MYSIGARFNNEQERLIRADGDAVGKAKIFQQGPRRFCFGIISEQAAIALVFKDVGRKVCEREFARCIGEVDGSIAGDVKIVRTSKTQTVGLAVNTLTVPSRAIESSL